jgi:hypothetical protein
VLLISHAIRIEFIYPRVSEVITIMDFNIQPGQLAKNGLRVTMLAAAVAVASCGGGGSSSSVGNAGSKPTPAVPVSTKKVYLTTENTAFDPKGGKIVVEARVIDQNVWSSISHPLQ